MPRHKRFAVVPVDRAIPGKPWAPDREAEAVECGITTDGTIFITLATEGGIEAGAQFTPDEAIHFAEQLWTIASALKEFIEDEQSQANQN